MQNTSTPLPRPPPFHLLLQLEVAREEDMVAEAATVEAVWVVEPPLLEGLLDLEIDALISEEVSACVHIALRRTQGHAHTHHKRANARREDEHTRFGRAYVRCTCIGSCMFSCSSLPPGSTVRFSAYVCRNNTVVVRWRRGADQSA